MSNWSSYFDKVEPKNWRFFDFYQYRKLQPDFSTFRKESFILKKSLENLMKCSSRDAKERAKILLDAHKASTLYL